VSSRWYNTGPRSLTGRFNDALSHPSTQSEIDMSADKDRGIRRQKQTRAKDIKRQQRQQRTPVGAAPTPPKQPAA